MQLTASKTWPRLFAEFVVIVVGVLAALGVDSYASWRNDRTLEQEYLERLYEDVQYDLDELAFVEAVANAALAYLDTLSNANALRDLEDTRLPGAIRVASNSREADLSRSTFQELVSSGRIGLIRSRAVRTDLAVYDRIVEEMSGFWIQIDTRFQDWAFSRLSYGDTKALDEACGHLGSLTAEKAPVLTRACSLSGSERSGASLRAEIGTADVQRLIRYQTNRVGGTAEIAQLLRGRALSLRETLTSALGIVPGVS